MKRLIALFLAFLLLTSNIGFAMATHFCGGHAVKSKLAIGMIDLDCGMAQMDTECENKPPKGITIKSEPCCNNDYQSLQTDDDYTSGLVHVKLHPDFVTAFMPSFFNVSVLPEKTKNLFSCHSPPPSGKNIQVLFQTFLI